MCGEVENFTVDDDGADVEILRRVDALILRRRCRDGDPTTTMLTWRSCDDVDVERSLHGSRRMKLDNCSRLFD